VDYKAHWAHTHVKLSLGLLAISRLVHDPHHIIFSCIRHHNLARLGSVPQDPGPIRRHARAWTHPSSPRPRDAQCYFSCVAARATAGVRALWRRRSRITILKPPPYRGRRQKHSSPTKIGAHIGGLLERCFVGRLLIFAIRAQTRGLLEMLLATVKCIFSARTPIPVNQHDVQELEARWYGSRVPSY
jgi:hypothetical protein